jgi:CBS domain-containing protein
METPVYVLLDEKSSETFSIAPDTPVAEAVSILNEKNIGSVLVLNSDEDLVGLFSERDVLCRVVMQRVDINTTPVSKVMTDKVVVLSPLSTVGEAMQVMTEKRCRHIPIIEGGKVSGVISAGDVTRHLAKNQQRNIDELVNYISGSY